MKKIDADFAPAGYKAVQTLEVHCEGCCFDFDEDLCLQRPCMSFERPDGRNVDFVPTTEANWQAEKRRADELDRELLGVRTRCYMLQKKIVDLSNQIVDLKAKIK
jgi:hypothetical protein